MSENQIRHHLSSDGRNILVKDATVQGSKTSTFIANWIHHSDRPKDVGAIIIDRGGGSDSNLQALTLSGSQRQFTQGCYRRASGAVVVHHRALAEGI
jgi:hypothetical protein